MYKQLGKSRNTSRFINLTSTSKFSQRKFNEGLDLSYQLTTIRKSLDKFSLQKNKKEQKLDELRVRLKMIENSQIVKNEDLVTKHAYKSLQYEVHNTRLVELEELENQKIYEFMYERLRNTTTFLEKRSRKLRKVLDITIHNAESMFKLRKETLDGIQKWKVLYKNELEVFRCEYDSIVEEISKMSVQSKSQKAVMAKTEEQRRHRLEIIENTMINDNGTHYEDLRNRLLLCKMYEKYLTRKTLMEMKEHGKLNEAYQQVRLKTGLSNIEEIIEKFLTQEMNYNELTQDLHMKESMLSEYQFKLVELQKNLGGVGEEKAIKNNSPAVLEEIINLGKVTEKKIEIEVVIRKINVWLGNMIIKLSPGLVQDKLEGKPLGEKFLILKDIVKKCLLVAKADEGTKIIENEKRKEFVNNLIEKYKLTKRLSALITSPKVVQSGTLSKSSSRKPKFS